MADVALGIVGSGRTIPLKGVKRYIGKLFNVTPLCIHIDGAAIAEDLVSKCRRDTRESIKYGMISYHEIMNLSHEARAAITNAVLLNINVKDIEADEKGQTEGSELPGPSEEPFYNLSLPLRLDCAVDRQGMSAVAYYDQSIGSEAMQKLMAMFKMTLIGLSNAKEGQRICDIASE